MHVTHPLFWVDEYGGHPRPGLTIRLADVVDKRWKPSNSANADRCLHYLTQLEAQDEHNLVIQPEHCLIGTSGHSVVPAINNAVQKWAEYTNKRVTYVMKGSNCFTEMYSALSAAVPVEDDPSTFADNELIGKLYASDRVRFFFRQ